MVAPKILYKGMSIDFNKELSLAIGDYYDIYDGMDYADYSGIIISLALHFILATFLQGLGF